MITFRTATRCLLAACVLSLSLTACDSAGPEPDAGAAPPVIAPAAFDLSDALFPDARGRAAASPQVGENFVNAALRVGGVTTILGGHLVLPSAVTAAALDAEPVFEDGSWIWSNTVRINESDVTFELAGTPGDTSVDWSMWITAADPVGGEVYDDFELYTAQTALDGASGSWQLYYRLDGARARVLEADFDDEGASARTLTFTVPEGVGNAGGDAVVYGTDGDARFFDWDQASEGSTHLVEWDAVTKAGSITATNFNGGERACWDADLEDVPCE